MHDILNVGDEDPKILTHVIDGFIIEESLSPFPRGLNFMTNERLNSIHKKQQEILALESNNENDASENNSLQIPEEVELEENNYATCEQCGFVGPKTVFPSANKRFCSVSCARRYAISYSSKNRGNNRLRHSGLARRRGRKYRRGSLVYRSSSRGRYHRSKPIANIKRNSVPNSFSDSSFSDYQDSNQSASDNDSLYSISSASSNEPPLPRDGDNLLRPLHWSVDDVWNYVRSLSDSFQHADEFRSQEIDGAALLLLHEEHLVTSMHLPLGPALKLCAHIDHLREQQS